MMQSPLLIHLNDPCLFFGYRNPDKGGARDIYHSLSHWVASEQFRGVDELIRESIIQSPTAAEARKTAERFKERRRLDWRNVRSSIFKSGLMMAAEQNFDILEKMREISKLTSLEVGSEFQSGQKICGYPLSWYFGLTWEASDAVINRPLRLLIAAGRNIEYSDRKTQVAKFVGVSPVTQVLVPITKETSIIGEEYAMQNNLPVRYFYSRKGKLSPSLASEIVGNSSQILVFEKKGAKLFDQLILAAKHLNKTIKLSLI
jgi:hypothetical protein